ncbi:MAG: tryptophan synthase subunit alpha [Betaproteobacteria bacterium]|jgi:tryptophan synthase alpha chain
MTSSRIEDRFKQLRLKGKKGLIPYIAAGDPSPSHTVGLMHTLAAAGADVIELGVPFSDPMADGPAIQRATERAIRQGVGLRQCLAMVESFRQDDQMTAVVLMGYANPIERFGRQAFVSQAKSVGVDGVLVVDYPPEESTEFAQDLKAAGLDPIFLLSPTSTELRIRDIVRHAQGYVYYVSLKGITGAANLDVDAVAAKIPVIRQYTDLPIGVGFGIRDAQSARAVAEVADAVVIGTRLIQEMEQVGADQAQAAVGSLLADIRKGMDA